MTRSASARARDALAALCLVLLALDAAVAQSPRATTAQAAARDWLVLTDHGDAQASWKAAGKKFHATLSRSGWAEALKKERAPLGAMKRRTTVKTKLQKTFPGLPDADYALIAYTTSFANKADAHETLTLELEADGEWRVVGYLVR